MPFGKPINVSWKDFCFWHEICIRKILGKLFWVHIPLKRYQNMSECSIIWALVAGIAYQQVFTDSELKTETLDLWKMFKVNKKDTRTFSLTLFWCFYYQLPSTTFSNVFIVDFEPVSVCWNGILKVRLSPSKKISVYLLQWRPFKNDEKCFLFYLKSSSRSQDI